MHRIGKTFSGITITAVFGAMTLFGQAQPAQGQAAQQTPAKQWKDGQVEYKMFEAVTKETDPNKKLALVDAWKQKYPETDFKVERLQLYLVTYQQLGRADKMMDTAKEMLALDPKDFQGLSVVIFLAPQLNNNSAEALDTAEKAANGVQANLDAQFSEEKQKLAKASDADWKKARTDMEALSHKTLGWVAMQRKSNDVAEQEFKKSLQLNPNAGEVDYWLGTVIVAQKKPDKYVEAFFFFARAVVYEGPGALPAQARPQIDAYLTKVYNNYHGPDDAGLKQLKEMAKAQPFPPENFKIKSQNEIAAEKEEEFKKTNPQLALWMSIKKELTAPNGEQYFESTVKGAAVPKLKGRLISAKPPVRSKELLVGLADPNTPEVTLKLDTALTGKPETGKDIQFEGLPASFTKEPFMVTFEVEKAKIEGLKMEAAPVKKAGPARKTGAKKKK